DAKIGAVELPTDTSFSVTVTSETDQAKLEDVSKRFLSEWTYTTGGGKWTYTLKDVSRRQIEDNAVAQALETIRNRIDEFGVSETLIARQGEIKNTAAARAPETIRNRIDECGVSEPLIARQGRDRILVQLPGIDDPKRVKDLIKNTAFLALSLRARRPL